MLIIFLCIDSLARLFARLCLKLREKRSYNCNSSLPGLYRIKHDILRDLKCPRLKHRDILRGAGKNQIKRALQSLFCVRIYDKVSVNKPDPNRSQWTLPRDVAYHERAECGDHR